MVLTEIMLQHIACNRLALIGNHVSPGFASVRMRGSATQGAGAKGIAHRAESIGTVWRQVLLYINME